MYVCVCMYMYALIVCCFVIIAMFVSCTWGALLY